MHHSPGDSLQVSDPARFRRGSPGDPMSTYETPVSLRDRVSQVVNSGKREREREREAGERRERQERPHSRPKPRPR